MSNITLSAPASGTATFTIAAPSSNTNRTLNLPDTTGTLVANGTAITSGTAQASTSGTAIDFTGIPSWAKRVTIAFNGVSTNGTSNLLVRVGSGAITTANYSSTSMAVGGANATGATSDTSGLVIMNPTAAGAFTGHMVLTLVSGTTWVGSHTGIIDATNGRFGAGNSWGITGSLDRVRITTVNGTDLFDAGSINIMWEG